MLCKRSWGRPRPTPEGRASRWCDPHRPVAAAVVVAAVVEAGSEKAAAHRLGLSHSTVKHHLASARSKAGVATTAQLVWILAPRLPEPETHPRRRSNGAAL
jgi:hypothetical protein